MNVHLRARRIALYRRFYRRPRLSDLKDANSALEHDRPRLGSTAAAALARQCSVAPSAAAT